MSNKYCTLIGNNEIKQEYQKINDGFDEVDKDISLNKARILNLINNPDGTKDLEIVDAHHSTAKGKIFETLDARLEEAEQDHKTHQADMATQAGGVHGFEIETGTFTPTIGTNTPSNSTYTIQTGTYSRIGNRVFINIRLKIDVKTIEDGDVFIHGLPFLANGEYSLAIGRIDYINLSGYPILGALTLSTAPRVAIRKMKESVLSASLKSSELSNGSLIFISGEYNI